MAVVDSRRKRAAAQRAGQLRPPVALCLLALCRRPALDALRAGDEARQVDSGATVKHTQP